MVDDESEYDRDEHECGHTDEEHARIEKVRGKFRNFLADVADDMLTPETLAKIIQVMDKHFKLAKVPNTLQTVKSFAEGFEFGIATFINVEHKSAEIMAGLRKIIKEREAQTHKIDITQSKPLHGNEENK